ncbi:MAG: uroporphyrinogen-III C-methyltransferase, partial [Oscillospiraceae bacterium]|nr:uroporphyrinogen-III C-methyltransferase [Oscillospiraceae bacterium]
MTENGFVWITGAGCGAADLISLRGLNAIRRADVIVYDDLIAQELLDNAKEGAELICMGKRGGRPSFSQEEINACLLEHARLGKRICRLKGGDPLVFGRGGEEALFLSQQKIPYEIIPGISSSIAVPSFAGIPVTHRKTARSFHVITAHTADSEEPLGDLASVYAKLPGTLIFLMGRSVLPRLARQLMEAGKDPSTPAAVISALDASCPIVAKAPLSKIALEADRCGVPSPAVILVGPTAALDLRSAAFLPLSGKHIAITGSPKIYDSLAMQLRALGADVLAGGRYSIKELPCSFTWERLREGGWIVFTSANGVQAFFRRLSQEGIDLRMLASCRFAVIGASTGASLQEHGFQPDLIPPEYTTAALAGALQNVLRPNEPVFLFRSARGNRELYLSLSKAAAVEDIALYDMTDDSPVC